MSRKVNNIIKAVWLILLGCFSSVLVQLSSLAWASDSKGTNNPNKIDYSSIKATEIVDRLSRTQDTRASTGSKAGLPALKELLFDEMFLYTAMGAMLLLVALIGAAYVISKRKGHSK